MSEWWEVPGGPTVGDDLGPKPANSAAPADAGPAPSSDTGSAASSDAAAAQSGDSSAADLRTCAWCATPAQDIATRCSSCGASLAQRETIGDLVIPGLTTVDPALKDYAARPMQLRGPSPSQGLASGAIVAAAAGGPVGIAALGGIAAVAAVEYLGASSGSANAANLGETSEAVRLALEKLERGEELPTATDETPRPELEAPALPKSNEEGSDGR